MFIYDIGAALSPTSALTFEFFQYSTCIKECPTVAGQSLAGLCYDQAQCDLIGTSYDTYATFPLMYYCIPEADTLTG